MISMINVISVMSMVRMVSEITKSAWLGAKFFNCKYFQSNTKSFISHHYYFSQCSLVVLPAQGRLSEKMAQARGCNGPTPTITMQAPAPNPHPLSYSHPHMVGCQGDNIKCPCVWSIRR